MRQWHVTRIYVMALMCLGATACSRQDTEHLARLGNRLAEHTRSRAGDIAGKLDAGFKSARGDSVLQERIQQRLRSDRGLADLALEVHVSGSEAEIKGTVKTPLQRQRALELAEMTIGVEKVNDALLVSEP